MSPALAGGFFTTEPPEKPPHYKALKGKCSPEAKGSDVPGWHDDRNGVKNGESVPGAFWVPKVLYGSYLYICQYLSFFNFLIFIYLATPGLSCSMWVLVP